MVIAEDISKPVGSIVVVINVSVLLIGMGVAIAPPERNWRTVVCPRNIVVMNT
jgi:hypothetical protein